MNNTLSKVLIFAAGAAIGSVVTWKLVQTKYEKIANEEIESVKEVFGAMHVEKDVTEPEPKDDIQSAVENKPADLIEQARDIIKANNYTNYSGTSESKEDKFKKMDDVEKPYTIPPDEYGEFYDYDTVELTYYSGDGVLAEDGGEPIDDIEGTVGQAALSSFGEYEDDSVHVRNDALQIDYEILFSLEKYSDAVSIGPRRVED